MLPEIEQSNLQSADRWFLKRTRNKVESRLWKFEEACLRRCENSRPHILLTGPKKNIVLFVVVDDEVAQLHSSVNIVLERHKDSSNVPGFGSSSITEWPTALKQMIFANFSFALDTKHRHDQIKKSFYTTNTGVQTQLGL